MVPALAAVRAEKAALRMIAAESAIFVILDIVLSPSFVVSVVLRYMADRSEYCEAAGALAQGVSDGLDGALVFRNFIYGGS